MEIFLLRSWTSRRTFTSRVKFVPVNMLVGKIETSKVAGLSEILVDQRITAKAAQGDSSDLDYDLKFQRYPADESFWIRSGLGYRIIFDYAKAGGIFGGQRLATIQLQILDPDKPEPIECIVIDSRNSVQDVKETFFEANRCLPRLLTKFTHCATACLEVQQNRVIVTADQKQILDLPRYTAFQLKDTPACERIEEMLGKDVLIWNKQTRVSRLLSDGIGQIPYYFFDQAGGILKKYAKNPNTLTAEIAWTQAEIAQVCKTVQPPQITYSNRNHSLKSLTGEKENETKDQSAGLHEGADLEGYLVLVSWESLDRLARSLLAYAGVQVTRSRKRSGIEKKPIQQPRFSPLSVQGVPEGVSIQLRKLFHQITCSPDEPTLLVSKFRYAIAKGLETGENIIVDLEKLASCNPSDSAATQGCCKLLAALPESLNPKPEQEQVQPPSTGGLFGSTAPAPSLFGGTGVVKTSPFGTPLPGPSLFDLPAPGQSLFGTPTLGPSSLSKPPPSSSLFDLPTPGPSLFGGLVPTPSLFANNKPASGLGGSPGLFSGVSSITANSQSSLIDPKQRYALNTQIVNSWGITLLYRNPDSHAANYTVCCLKFLADVHLMEWDQRPLWERTALDPKKQGTRNLDLRSSHSNKILVAHNIEAETGKVSLLGLEFTGKGVRIAEKHIPKIGSDNPRSAASLIHRWICKRNRMFSILCEQKSGALAVHCLFRGRFLPVINPRYWTIDRKRANEKPIFQKLDLPGFDDDIIGVLTHATENAVKQEYFKLQLQF